MSRAIWQYEEYSSDNSSSGDICSSTSSIDTTSASTYLTQMARPNSPTSACCSLEEQHPHHEASSASDDASLKNNARTNNGRRQRLVRFGGVTVQEHSVTVGQAPYCEDGFPLELDWKHVEPRFFPSMEAYEKHYHSNDEQAQEEEEEKENQHPLCCMHTDGDVDVKLCSTSMGGETTISDSLCLAKNQHQGEQEVGRRLAKLLTVDDRLAILRSMGLTTTEIYQAERIRKIRLVEEYAFGHYKGEDARPAYMPVRTIKRFMDHYVTR